MVQRQIAKRERSQRRESQAQLEQLMAVAEAARLTMGTDNEAPLAKRLMLEDHSQTKTAEDAWRADRSPGRRATLRPQASSASWVPTWAGLFGGGATA
ncbi:MAG: hypothetical protein AAGG72_08905 [Pseudomonadota bacterium]